VTDIYMRKGYRSRIQTVVEHRVLWIFYRSFIHCCSVITPSILFNGYQAFPRAKAARALHWLSTAS